MISWEKNASDILSEIHGESVDSESVEVDEEDSKEPENATFSQTVECFLTLKSFALCRGQGAMLDHVMNMEDMFVEMRVDSKDTTDDKDSIECDDENEKDIIINQCSYWEETTMELPEKEEFMLIK
ncbi:hypothetical protein ACF0H5_021814 [Mactra antiquata]